MIQTKIYKINPEYLEEYKKWGALLMGDLLEDAKNALTQEGCILETIKLFSIQDAYFVVGIMVSEQGISQFNAPLNTEINKLHKMHNKNFFMEEIPNKDLYLIENHLL